MSTEQKPRLPFGQTEPQKWGGGTAIIRLRGNFVTSGGVGTYVVFHHEVQRPDGVYERGPFDGKTFNAPGTYQLKFPAGRYWFHCSGPSAPIGREPPPHTPDQREQRPLWSVEIDVDIAFPKPKSVTLEQRVAALERGEQSHQAEPKRASVH